MRAYREAKKHMYFLIKHELEKVSRPTLRCGTGNDLQTFEPGLATETLGRWRNETLWQVAQTWLGSWEDEAA